MNKKDKIFAALLVVIILLCLCSIATRHIGHKRHAAPAAPITTTTQATQTTKPKTTIQLKTVTEAPESYSVVQGKAEGSIESEEVKAETTTKKTVASTTKQTAKIIQPSDKGEALIDSYRVDKDYGKKILKLSEDQLKGVAGLVMGEMGCEGYVGCCLAAQAIKDRMIDMNCFDVYAFKRKAGYTAEIKSNPNSDSIKAVDYVFNKGGYAVKHRILYMYGSGICYSSWHETQKFVVEYNKERYFDKW